MAVRRMKRAGYGRADGEEMESGPDQCHRPRSKQPRMRCTNARQTTSCFRRDLPSPPIPFRAAAARSGARVWRPGRERDACLSSAPTFRLLPLTCRESAVITSPILSSSKARVHDTSYPKWRLPDHRDCSSSRRASIVGSQAVRRLEAFRIIDPTVLFHAGRWWLFGGLPTTATDLLWLWSATEVAGPYEPTSRKTRSSWTSSRSPSRSDHGRRRALVSPRPGQPGQLWQRRHGLRDHRVVHREVSRGATGPGSRGGTEGTAHAVSRR